MSKGNTFENDFLKLVFQNTAITLIGDAAGLLPSAAAGSLYASLHTADPGEAGDQTTNETVYTNYARVAVARTAGGWTITNNQVVNAAEIAFPQCGATGATLMFWAIGASSSGAGKILYKGHIGTTPLPFTAVASTDAITIPGHSLAVDDRVVFYADPAAALPTGISEGTVYWVKTVSGNAITISTTQGGATLDITADGAGMGAEVTPLAVSNLITPRFQASQLVVKEH